VDNVCQRTKLAFEAVDRGSVDEAQRLDRHNLVSLPIVRPVDYSHSAGADTTLNGKPRSTAELLRPADTAHSSLT
jgi:hypothetical protein